MMIFFKLEIQYLQTPHFNDYQTMNSADLNRDSSPISLFLPTPFSCKLLTSWNFSIVSANVPVRSDSIPFRVILNVKIRYIINWYSKTKGLYMTLSCVMYLILPYPQVCLNAVAILSEAYDVKQFVINNPLFQASSPMIPTSISSNLKKQCIKLVFK